MANDVSHNTSLQLIPGIHIPPMDLRFFTTMVGFFFSAWVKSDILPLASATVPRVRP
jgi:hypothetical protein